MTRDSEDVTGLLVNWSAGDRDALDQVIRCIYVELHRIAERQFRRERSDNTLQLALVNEPYLRMVKQTGVNWQNRSQFFGIGAKVMRQALVDRARTRCASKRGSGNHKLDLTDSGDVPDKIQGLMCWPSIRLLNVFPPSIRIRLEASR